MNRNIFVFQLFGQFRFDWYLVRLDIIISELLFILQYPLTFMGNYI